MIWFILCIAIIAINITWCSWVVVKRSCRKFKKSSGEINEIKVLRNDMDESALDKLEPPEPAVANKASAGKEQKTKDIAEGKNKKE